MHSAEKISKMPDELHQGSNEKSPRPGSQKASIALKNYLKESGQSPGQREYARNLAFSTENFGDSHKGKPSEAPNSQTGTYRSAYGGENESQLLESMRMGSPQPFVFNSPTQLGSLFPAGSTLNVGANRYASPPIQEQTLSNAISSI